MQHLLLAVGACLTIIIHSSSGACPAEAATFDYAGQLCQADIVFRGQATAGRSGVGGGGQYPLIISASHTFQVTRYFRDNTGRRESQLEVGRVYTQGDPCDSAFLYHGYGSHVIFARGNNTIGGHLSVPPCGGVVPWVCVPRSAKQVLSRRRC